MGRRIPAASSETVSKVMKANRGKDTGPELILRRALRDAGFSGYRLHWKVPGRPDIAYPGRKIAIFVHGCFWHRCPHCNPSVPKTNTEFWESKFQRNIERDARKVRELEEAGWRVLIIWECRIKNDIGGCVDMIRALIENPG